ncbi:MAG: DMT family transporter [Lachnospiraceae bacterium]
MYQLFSVLTGLILAVMISINGNLSEQYGVYTAAVIIHIVGVVFAFFLCTLRKEKYPFHTRIPVWVYSGGAIGVFTTISNNLAFGHISMTSIVALGLFGQLTTSLFIDCLGLFGMKKHPFRKASLAAFLFAIAGILVMLDSTVTTRLYAVLFSLGSGISVVLSRTVNARLSQKIGALQGSFINHLVGLPITVIIALLAAGSHAAATPVMSIRPWIYLGGTLGVIVVLLCNITVPKVPAFRLTVLTFIGQIFTGIILDIITGNSHSDTSFTGGIIIALGIAANMALEHRAAS